MFRFRIIHTLDEATAERLDSALGLLGDILEGTDTLMIDTSKILAAATRATTDSAALRALVKDVKSSLEKSLADLAAAIAANDPAATAKAQADLDAGAALLDTDSAETEAALTANVAPAPAPEPAPEPTPGTPVSTPAS